MPKTSIRQKYSTIKLGSFADGIRMLNEKRALMLPANLTKKRAIILLDFIDEFKRNWYCDHKEGDDFLEDDMQKACQWLLNQINKRWSQNELYYPNKKQRKHEDGLKIKDKEGFLIEKSDGIKNDEKNKIRYKCLLCGRDKFAKPGPHTCGKQYRKRGLKWEKVSS